MEICIERNYIDEDWIELVGRTDMEMLDVATIDEIKHYRGEVCGEGELKTDWLYSFLRKNAVGKMAEGGEHKFIRCLRLGELDVSMQLAYRLFCLRSDRDPNYRIGKDGYKAMTEKEFNLIFPYGDDSDTQIDICIWNNVTMKTYQRATQMRLIDIDDFLRGIVYDHKMECRL